MNFTQHAVPGSVSEWPDSAPPPDGRVRILVPYTTPGVTRETLIAARMMTHGLSATIVLVAVHVIPYPSPFHIPQLVREHLENRLADMAGDGPDRVEAIVVLARSAEEGFHCVVSTGGAVVIGTRKRWWPTRESRLAKLLERCGCKVVMVKLEEEE